MPTPTAPRPAPVASVALESGRLVWISEASGEPRAVMSNGPGEREVTDLPGLTFPAAADPRGTHVLVVQSTEDPHTERLWLVPMEGGEAVAVSSPAQKVRTPSWAPDGSALVYASDRESFSDLYRVARDGSGERRLTSASHGSFEPAYGRLGRVAFVSSRDMDAEIYVMNDDGSDPRRLTRAPGDDMQPAWLPDGRLGWLALREGVVDVWTMRPDGSDPKPFRQARPVGTAEGFAFAPDGKRVAVTMRRGSDTGIDVLEADGRLAFTLDGPGPDEHPTWTPQGLVFSSGRSGAVDLWLADAEGEVTPLTRRDSADWLPRFLP